MIDFSSALDWVTNACKLRVCPAALQRRKASATGHTLPLPGYKQLNSYGCGHAAVMSVLRMYDRSVNSEAVWQHMAPCPDMGSSTTSLIRTLRAGGVVVRQRDNLTFRRLQQALDEGWPIITTVSTAEPDVDHWVTIYGYSTRGNGSLYLSGMTYLDSGSRQTWEYFRQTWSPKGFGLVCSKRGD